MKTLEQKMQEVIEDTDSLIKEERCASIADQHALDFAGWVLSWAASQFSTETLEDLLSKFKNL